MKGRPGDRRPDGRHGLLLLHHLPGRPAFHYGKRVTTPAQWIDSTPPGRRCMTFGYTLFPGAGDPAKLPTQATLTLLLRLTAGWKGPLAAPSRPFPAGIPRQPRIPCGSFPERAQNFLIFCSFPVICQYPSEQKMNFFIGGRQGAPGRLPQRYGSQESYGAWS